MEEVRGSVTRELRQVLLAQQEADIEVYSSGTLVVSVLPVPAGPAGAPPNLRCKAPVSVR